jgi:hypothetical protein
LSRIPINKSLHYISSWDSSKNIIITFLKADKSCKVVKKSATPPIIENTAMVIKELRTEIIKSILDT